jgi:magnesium-transporting ATPase (P-type)
MIRYPFNSSLARMSVIATVSTCRKKFITFYAFQLIGGKFLGSKKEKGIRVLVKGAPEAIKPLLNIVSFCMHYFIFYHHFFVFNWSWFFYQVPVHYDACYQAAAGVTNSSFYNIKPLIYFSAAQGGRVLALAFKILSGSQSERLAPKS